MKNILCEVKCKIFIMYHSRKQSRSTRKNEKEDRSRNERTKNLSRCNNDIACILEDRSSSRR